MQMRHRELRGAIRIDGLLETRETPKKNERAQNHPGRPRMQRGRVGFMDWWINGWVDSGIPGFGHPALYWAWRWSDVPPCGFGAARLPHAQKQDQRGNRATRRN